MGDPSPGGRSSSPTSPTSAPSSRRGPSAQDAPRPGADAAWQPVALSPGLRRQGRQPLYPQPPPAARATTGLCSLLFQKTDLTWPNLQLTVRQAQGRDRRGAGRGAQRRPEPLRGLEPEAAQAETPLAGSSGSAPAELSPARRRGSDSVQRLSPPRSRPPCPGDVGRG